MMVLLTFEMRLFCAIGPFLPFCLNQAPGLRWLVRTSLLTLNTNMHADSSRHSLLLGKVVADHLGLVDGIDGDGFLGGGKGRVHCD